MGNKIKILIIAGIVAVGGIAGAFFLNSGDGGNGTASKNFNKEDTALMMSKWNADSFSIEFDGGLIYSRSSGSGVGIYKDGELVSEEGDIYYAQVYKGDLYAILKDYTEIGEHGYIYRLEEGQSDFVKVSNEKVYTLQVYDDGLYYNKEDGYYRADINGENVEKIFDDDYYTGIDSLWAPSPYIIDGVAYHEIKDEKGLYAYNLKSKEDEMIAPHVEGEFIIDGNTVYYAAFDPNDNTTSFYSSKLGDMGESTLITRQAIRTYNLGLHESMLTFSGESLGAYAVPYTLDIEKGTLTQLVSEEVYCENLSYFKDYITYVDYSNVIHRCDYDGTNDQIIDDKGKRQYSQYPM